MASRAWLACAELLIWVQILDLGLPNLLTQKTGAAFGAGEQRDLAAWFTAGFGTLVALGVVVSTAAFFLAPLVVEWSGLTGSEGEALAGAFRLGAVANASLRAW